MWDNNDYKPVIANKKAGGFCMTIINCSTYKWSNQE